MKAPRGGAFSCAEDGVRGLVSLRQPRFPEAIAEAKRALACNPFSSRITQHLGFTFYCERKYDLAILQYQRAIELDPDNGSVHEAMGDVYYREVLNQRAIDEWTRGTDPVDAADLGAVP